MSEKSASKAVFTTGSTMRHVVVMTATSSVGLVSIFAVDALNLFYISLLGQQELAAAIGYAATSCSFPFRFASASPLRQQHWWDVHWAQKTPNAPKAWPHGL
jgi:hypothetical protein